MDLNDQIALPGALVTDKNNAIMTPMDSPETTQFEATINDTITEETMGYTFAKDFTLKGKKGAISFIANIKLKEIVMVEKSKLEGGEDAYRYIADEELIVTRNGDTKTYHTDGLHEIVYLKK